MTDDKSKRRGSRKPASRAAKKTRVSAKKKNPTKKVAAKSAAKSLTAKKIGARKSVPIKTARVSKRALLPPLPPPVVPLQAKRSAARVPSRAKVLGRARAVKTGKAVFDIPVCTESVLREKLRLAAPYLELWLSRAEEAETKGDASTPEAAFVRLWQWLMLEATLEGSDVVITPGLVEKLFAEEMRPDPIG
jgi:hypothetical protein